MKTDMYLSLGPMASILWITENYYRGLNQNISFTVYMSIH